MEKIEISAAEFKATCLKLMDEVKEKHMRVVIKKRGKVVAELVPPQSDKPSLFGLLQGAAVTEGDIMEPLNVTWEAEN